MLKRLLIFTLVLFTASFASAQTLDELKAKKAELEATLGEKKGEVGALEGELAGIQKEIDILSGWTTGFSGIVGFAFNQSNNWAANPNPDASSTALNIGITAFANQEGRKHFWRNKAVISKAWQDFDLTDAENDDLFDNGTVDILNISSLAGYKINDWFALSALGELNTSIENFLEPGTFDFGIGGTLTPVENLVIVIHPLNYHVAFSGNNIVDTQGSLGAKIRADYTKNFKLAGKDFSWSSTFTTFIPYGKPTQNIGGVDVEIELFEYLWLNTLAFQVWNGVGVGVSTGLRQADFEFDGTQSFYTIGLTYNF